MDDEEQDITNLMIRHDNVTWQVRSWLEGAAELFFQGRAPQSLSESTQFGPITPK
jgi:hypothetical protein